MIETILKQQKDYFNNGQTLSLSSRIHALDTLEAAIKSHQQALEDALRQDLAKSPFEAYATEIGFILRSLRDMKKMIKPHMRVKRVKTPWTQVGSKSYTRDEPLGSVLIIGPYNYPFQLVIEPLIGALAAGNTAIVKPSEFTPNTAAVIEAMLNGAFEPALVKVFTGGAEVTQSLTAQPFNHIFFTGSTRVGQLVYEAAAKNLVPVTLELGGKSPTIVDETANLKVAARRIVYGKFLNAGQTCIAPDYVYVHESVVDDFVHTLSETLKSFYPDNPNAMGHIVNEGHYTRLKALIDPKKVIYEGTHQPETRYLSPVLMQGVTWEDGVMKEEIFGPILPILSYRNLNEVIEEIRAHEKPLALYLFSENKATQETVFSTLSFGGGAINDTIMHVANPHLPFGGVGASGIGAYHGKHSLETFSHRKAYMKKSTRFDPSFLYPPYSEKQVGLIKKILK